jgi:murein DD-endopeptidase MepM/ murein hydrolase activator NlpD
MASERRASVLRGLLLFLLGALVGANAVYYAMTREVGPAPQARGAPLAGAAQGERQPALPLRHPWRKTPTAQPTQPVLTPPLARPGGTASASSAGTTGPLLIPVQGIAAAQLQDTFTDARGEGRSHDAIDIMAPSGTPVVAVADGPVEKLFDSKQGGLTVYQFNMDRTHAYYYAHLQDYAPGLAEGQVLRRGQLVGRVGYTGNASPDAPHLHFAIFVLGPEKRWWEGTAINPYPLLAGGAR